MTRAMMSRYQIAPKPIYRNHCRDPVHKTGIKILEKNTTLVLNWQLGARVKTYELSIQVKNTNERFLTRPFYKLRVKFYEYNVILLEL